MSSNKSSIDEQEEKRLFTPRTYSFDEYLSALTAREKVLREKSKSDWSRPNVTTHSDPFAVQLEVLYMMMRHIMWKLTTCENDVSEMAFCQHRFERAMEEAEARMWRMAEDPDYQAPEVVESKEEESPFSLLERLHKGRKERVRTIRQTINIEES